MKEQEVVLRDFTTVEQSKILSEFLPTETANMVYCYTKEGDKLISNVPIHLTRATTNTFKHLCCWSTAALTKVLPPYLFEFERGIDLNIYPNLNGNGWHCSYMPNCIENRKNDKFTLITSANNLIDAVFEMILKLHELKLL